MKKLATLLLVLISLAVSVSSLAATVKITSSGGAKVRSGPDASTSYLGKVEYNHEYEYLETASNGWLKIRLADGTEGYISGKMGTVTDGTVSQRSTATISSSQNESYVSWTLSNKKEVQVTKSIYDDMMTWYEYMDQTIYHMFWLQDYDSKEFKAHANKASSMEALKAKCDKNATRSDDKKFIKDIEDSVDERIQNAAKWL